MERGMTLNEVADASGLSLRHLSSVENGQSTMGLTVLAALSTALGVPPVWFFILPGEDEIDRLFDRLRKMSPDELREFEQGMQPLLRERSERNGGPSTEIQGPDREWPEIQGPDRESP